MSVDRRKTLNSIYYIERPDGRYISSIREVIDGSIIVSFTHDSKLARYFSTAVEAMAVARTLPLIIACNINGIELKVKKVTQPTKLRSVK